MPLRVESTASGADFVAMVQAQVPRAEEVTAVGERCFQRYLTC